MIKFLREVFPELQKDLFKDGVKYLITAVLGVLGIWAAARWEAANIQLKKDSLRDELTGLFNYKAFPDKLKESMATAKKDKKAISIILIDVDNLGKNKSITYEG